MIRTPLFDQTLHYADQICSQVERMNLGVYHARRMVNYVYRFDSYYFDSEQQRFLDDPDGYQGSGASNPIDAHLLDKPLGRSLLLSQVLKVLAHQGFRLIGWLQSRSLNKSEVSVLRRCYVEDVEALFSSNDNVLRYIYPFPLSPGRQWRYIKSLRAANRQFVLSGLPYAVGDVWRLLWHRTHRQLLKMEARAQIRHAFETRQYPALQVVECSDEYDFGSIYYSAALRRRAVTVRNSAHGISKYLPHHAYTVFDVLTEAQQHYYERYNRVRTQVRALSVGNHRTLPRPDKTVVVLLGQYSQIISPLVLNAEKQMLDVLSAVGSRYPHVELYYKKHPNNDVGGEVPENVQLADNRIITGNPARIIQFSLYSTCQIDPSFIGYKFLVESRFIKPQFAFDDQEPIVKIDDLDGQLDALLNEREARYG